MPKILVIDDDASIRSLLTDVLEVEGFTVRTAEDGFAGLRLIAADRPDCVVLDVMMPGMDGFDVLRAVRADPRLAGLPVVMFSAAADPGRVTAATALGAQGYLVKGHVDYDALAATVARYAADPAARPPAAP